MLQREKLIWSTVLEFLVYHQLALLFQAYGDTTYHGKNLWWRKTTHIIISQEGKKENQQWHKQEVSILTKVAAAKK